jgi:hypothetical protein
VLYAKRCRSAPMTKYQQRSHFTYQGSVHRAARSCIRLPINAAKNAARHLASVAPPALESRSRSGAIWARPAGCKPVDVCLRWFESNRSHCMEKPAPAGFSASRGRSRSDASGRTHQHANAEKPRAKPRAELGPPRDARVRSHAGMETASASVSAPGFGRAGRCS